MGIFKRFLGLENESYGWLPSVVGRFKLSSRGVPYSKDKALKISAVYRAVNVISDNIAKLELLPFNYVDEFKYKEYNDLYYLLNVEPNPTMSGFLFKKYIVVYMLLRGNAYVWIDRDTNNNIRQLRHLNPDLMEVEVTQDGIEYTYNKKYHPDQSDILHFQNYSSDNFGILGESTLTYAYNSMSLSYNSEEHARKFFEGGASMSGILSPKDGVILKEGSARRAKEKMQESLNPDLGNSAGIIVLDSGLQFQPVSISPRDSQLLETRQFNISDIARWFGTPLSMLFSGDNKYNTAEGEMLAFMNNCLQPIIEKLEIEFFRKLYLRSEWNEKDLLFDVSNLYRLDSVAQAEYFTKLENVGGLLPNDIRQKLHMPPVKGGNRAFVQVNLQPLDNLNADKDLIQNKRKNVNGEES